MTESNEKENALLEDVVARIRSIADPDAIVLFGSRARGDASPQSDLDLLIIQESELPRYRRAVKIRKALNGVVSDKDLIVFTPSEVEEWRTAPTSLVATALREGRILYEKQH